jgi:hypothetical protein
MRLRIAPPPLPNLRRQDPLAAALLAAEMDEPYAYDRLPITAIVELAESVKTLRVSVPFATLRLLARLAHDERTEVRAQIARLLTWFADLYPERVEQLLMPMACDVNRKVRAAVAESLADLLESLPAPEALIDRWERLPDRGREVLDAARSSLHLAK